MPLRVEPPKNMGNKNIRRVRMKILNNSMRRVSIVKYLAFAVALAMGFVQVASAAWKPAVVSLIQLELEMESCGFLDDKDKIYTRCLQINHPVHHGWNHSRWNARGTMCKALIAEYDAAFEYRQDVANDTDLELSGNSCIGQVLDVALESVRADAVDNAPAPGENKLCLPCRQVVGARSTQQKNEGESACRGFCKKSPRTVRTKAYSTPPFIKCSTRRLVSNEFILIEVNCLRSTCVNWKETVPPRAPDVRDPSAGDQCMVMMSSFAYYGPNSTRDTAME